MKAFASLLLAVGCLWAMFVAWLFVAIEGVADTPKSLFMTWLYWCGMLIGPLALIVGSALLLRSIQSRRGLILIEIGSVILTIFALYNSVTGMQRKPLQPAPPYLFYFLLLLIMLLSDIAAYRLYRALGVRR